MINPLTAMFRSSRSSRVKTDYLVSLEKIKFVVV